MAELRELHFYPGPHVLVYKIDGKEAARYEGWGGPRLTTASPNMNKGPTDPGHYVISVIAPYKTKTWPLSQIAWGTPLQDKGDDVWYQASSKKWRSVYKDFNITRDQIIELMQERLDVFRQEARAAGMSDADQTAKAPPVKVPDTWIFNDFGARAYRYTLDQNQDGQPDKDKHGNVLLPQGDMIHTTPTNELESGKGLPVYLVESHGCVHVMPKDRDAMERNQALKVGTRFIVHTYDEKP
jgi:hypothetical protein